jgi:MYXO-CTERM domain-containing protein
LVDGAPELVGLNVFTSQPDGRSGCEGGGTGTLLAAEVWDWVEAEVEGTEWQPGCGGCGTGERSPKEALLAALLALGAVEYKRRPTAGLSRVRVALGPSRRKVCPRRRKRCSPLFWPCESGEGASVPARAEFQTHPG